MNSLRDDIQYEYLQFFAKDYDKVGETTRITLDIKRNELPSIFKKLNYKKGAEIGVERGKYSKVLCENIPDLTLHCIDPLEPYGDYRQHVSKEKMDGFYTEFQVRMLKYRTNFLRLYSLQAVKLFEDNYLDFVYIDANHDFQNTANDIVEWSKKVKVGGIVAGHDYTHFVKEYNRCDVKYVVDAYVKSYGIKMWYITNEKSPSWFFVKE